MAKQRGGPDTPEKRERLRKQGWQKGQSGNPKGRPPMPQEVKDKMARYSPAAIDVMYELMMNSENDMVRLKAAENFKNVMVSNAAQKVEHDVKHSVVGEFLANANKRRAELAAPETQVIEATAIEVQNPEEGTN